MGQVDISGGTINAITENIDMPTDTISGRPGYAYSGNVWFPDALYVIGGTYGSEDAVYGNSLRLNISGGEFNCANGKGSAVAVYDLGRVSQAASVSISGDAKLASNADGRRAYQVVSFKDMNVEPIEGYGDASLTGKISTSISGGLFSDGFDKSYCVPGLTIVENTDESTKKAYPYTVATIKASGDDQIGTGTAAGETVAAVSGDISEGDKKSAKDVAESVSPAENAVIPEATPITDDDKDKALTALVNGGKLTLTDDNKIPEGTKVSVIKEVYFDVELTDYSNDPAKAPTVQMNITPKYNLIAVAETAGKKDEVTLRSAQPASVNTPTKVTVTLPDQFKNKEVYIRHNSDIYTAIADDNGKITFTTNGFSPFVFALSDPDAVAEVNGNAYKTLQEAADAAKDGDEIFINSGESHTLNFNASKSVKITNRTGRDITVKFNGADRSLAKDAAETFSYTKHSGSSSSSSSSSSSTPSASKPEKAGFDDVASSDWFASAVDYVTEKGMMNGTGKTTFSPDAETTRGMIVTVLYRLEKEPLTASASFKDVPSGQYYADAVAWASANGIVTGYSSEKFGPEDRITREQLAAILYRYAQFKKYDVTVGEDTNILSYDDAQSISEYAVPAIQWACGSGVMNGKTGNKLDPKGGATRAEAAAMLMRFCEDAAK